MPAPTLTAAAGYEVVVLEGCDGTGKTTLATALAVRHGYTVMHFGRTPGKVDLAARYRSVLSRPGRIVLDRSFISELVYGPLRHGRSRLSMTAAAVNVGAEVTAACPGWWRTRRCRRSAH